MTLNITVPAPLGEREVTRNMIPPTTTVTKLIDDMGLNRLLFYALPDAVFPLSSFFALLS
jgi:hypothetical protein